MTTSAASIEELKKVSKVMSRKQWLISLACVIEAVMAYAELDVARGAGVILCASGV